MAAPGFEISIMALKHGFWVDQYYLFRVGKLSMVGMYNAVAAEEACYDFWDFVLVYKTKNAVYTLKR
jgi:hypothetical protein